MQNMKKRLKRAFTLTELVIVIAVIAVLMAVLIPTFASVIKSANESHDQQYLAQINTSLAGYTARNNKPAADYPEMMKALAADGLCDEANPYLLAKKLKEKDVRMVWFPNTEKVQLVDTSRETLLWQTGATRGLGNFALMNTTDDKDVISGAGCYVLCVAGDKSCESAADLYYEFYETCGGKIDSFNKNVDDYLKNMTDKSWANSITAAINNLKNGYIFDTSVEEEIKDALTGSGSATLKTDTPEEVKTALATLSSMAADATTMGELSGRKVTFEAKEGTKVEMKDITLGSIGNSYRKESNVAGGVPQSTVSVDFGNIELDNVNVPKNFVSSGAEWQEADDSGHAKGGYAFTYGLFGSIIAAAGETVTIENLKINGVQMDFSGASETINGKRVDTFADNAGVIAGYTQGNVVLKNITIDGRKEGETSGNGFIKGYDAIAGVVGRAYGAMNNGARVDSTLKLDGVKVSNLEITGERRASGFVGYNQQNENVVIENCELDNVTIRADRNDVNKAEQCWATVFIHQGCTKTLKVDGKDTTYQPGKVSIDKVTLKNVTTAVNFQGKDINSITGDKIKKDIYLRLESNTTGSGANGPLLLVAVPDVKNVHVGTITFGSSASSLNKDFTAAGELK